MQAQQVDERAAATLVPEHVMGKAASASRAVAKWLMYFAISFGLTAGFLILAHV